VRKWNIVAAVALLAIAAATLQAYAAGKLKIGFVYLGPIGDLGWTFQHEVGRRALVTAFGDRIETTYLENVPEGPDAERSIEQLVRAGHQFIFAASFGYMDPVIKVAAKYPNVHFEHATGYKRAPMRRGRTRATISRASSPRRCRRPAC
jgi:basic membrane protein A and related proteins